MRLKYYIRGLGIGMVVTTIMLTISNNIRNEKAYVSKTNTTEETTSSIIAYTEKESTTEDTKGADSTEELTSTEQTTEAFTEPETQQATEPETQPQTEPETQPATEPETQPASDQQMVTIVIKDVYYASQAADILYDAGVITDKSGFISYLAQTGYANKIKEGNYNINKGESFENIAKIITRTK